MTLPQVIILNPVPASGVFNVTVDTSGSNVTSLALLARLASTLNNPPIFVLDKIRKNGVTRYQIDPGHYVFAAPFENVTGPAMLAIAITTPTAPSTVPFPVTPGTAPTGQKQSISIDVYV